MDFYKSVLRRSGQYCVALCLENGLVGQGLSKEEALGKLKEAIESLMEVQGLEDKLSHTAIAINELHEFLTIMQMNDNSCRFVPARLNRRSLSESEFNWED